MARYQVLLLYLPQLVAHKQLGLVLAVALAAPQPVPQPAPATALVAVVPDAVPPTAAQFVR